MDFLEWKVKDFGRKEYNPKKFMKFLENRTQEKPLFATRSFNNVFNKILI